MAATTDSGPTTDNGSKGANKPSPKPIDKSKNKFLLYGITYLMATPSHFSRAVARDGENTIRDFLTQAGISNPNDQQEAIDFTNSITRDNPLTMAMEAVHDSLQSDFGGLSYAPTPCPTRDDSLKILAAMSKI